MRQYEPQTRYRISESQQYLLLCILKYRFISSDLLAAVLQKDRSTIYERLSILVDQKYIVKLYDNSYRLRNRPAIYYLAPLGLRYLKQHGFARTQLQYKNKYISDEQIDEQLLLAHLSRTVFVPYKESFNLYTKYQLIRDNEYPKPLPYAMLADISSSIVEYLVEYIPAGMPSWQIRSKINQHIDFADERRNTSYPHLLLIAGNKSTQTRIIRMTYSIITTFAVFTTTKEQVLQGKADVWFNSYDYEDYGEDEELRFEKLPLHYKL